MDYRKFAIRVLYASISIAVFAGVLTLFAPGSRDVIGRLLGTAITTAIAAALLLVAIRALETPPTRPLGVTLGILVCFLYISIVSAIWADLINHPVFRSIQDKSGISALFIAGCSLPILIGAACLRKPRARLAGMLFLGIWVVVLLSWLLDTWISRTIINIDMEYFALPLMIFSPISLFVLIARDFRMRLVGIVLVVIGCFALQIAAFTTGGNIDNSPNLFVTTLLVGWASAALGLWNLITFRDKKFALPWFERLTILLCGIALGALCIVIWFEINQFTIEDLLGRISGSSGILASAAVLAIVVTQLLRSTIFIKDEGTELSVSCPRCLKNLFIPQGKSLCPFCNLQFKVHIESAGCRKCGYDLKGSSDSNCCPECGERIVISDETN